MATHNGKVEQAQSGPVQPTDDYSIYPHRDHATASSIPFLLEDYGDRGALSEDQIYALSAQHDLSMAQLRELSRLVGYSLDIDSEVSLVTISRSTAVHRLQDRKLAKRSRELQLDASQANALFKSLNMNVMAVDNTEEASPDPQHLKVPPVPTDEVTLVSLDEARRILQPNNRSKERDNRRLLVVESCCYVALDAGWPLTYTTDDTVSKNQRGGRLINLIKDVVAMVSRNARIASVHTLKSDIELVRRRFERRGDLPAQARRKQNLDRSRL